MEEHFEAHAYLKYKGEKDPTKTDENYKKLVSLLGKLLFEKALTDVYNEGMKFGCADPEFMLKLTDFFVTASVSFYMTKESEEETIKKTSLFLDALKQDVINCIKGAYQTKEKLKF